MKVLSNLLTVLAALLNLASGCGLRGKGAGQGLLQLGSAIAQQSLSGVSSGGALSAVGAVLRGGSSGRLLSGLQSLRGGTLGSGLTSGVSVLGSSGANSGLQELGVLSNRLGGTSGGALLAGIEKIAVNRLHGSVSSGSISSGSSTGVSGGQSGLLVTGLQQPGPTLAGGFLATATSTRSSTTSVGLRTGGNAAGNLLGVVATTGGGHPGGVLSIAGDQPAFGGQGTEGIPGSPGAVPGAGQGVRMPGSLGGLPGIGLHEGVSSSSRVSASSVSASGGNSMQGLRQPLQQNRPGVGGGSPGTGSIATQMSTLSAQYVGSTVGNVGLAASPNGGGSGGILPSEVDALDSPRPGLAALPGTQPAAGVPGGSTVGGIATGILNEGGSSGIGVPGSSNSVSGQRLGQGVGQIVPGLHGATGGPATASLQSVAGIAVHTAGSSARTLIGAASSLGAAPVGGVPSRGIGPGSRGAAPGTSLLEVQGLGQGPHQNGQPLGAAIITGATSTLQTMSSVGDQRTRGATGTLLRSPTGGVPGDVSPGGNMGPGAGLLGVQGLRQDTHRNEQQLGAAITTGATSTLQTMSTMGAQMTGGSTGTLLRSPTGGVPGGVSPGVNIGPGTSPADAGNILEQGLGQGADQVSQSIRGTYVRGASAIQQSTTRLGTQLPGSFPGGGLGQGPLEGTQPGHVPGGVSRVTVSASSQSSSWRSQTHVVSGSAGNVVAGLPSLGGPGSGVGVPIGPPGSGSAGAGAGTGSALLHAIVGAAGAGRPQGGPGPVVQGAMGVISSGVGSGSVSSGMVSGVAHTVRKPHRRGPSAAAAAGLALGTVASALALTAIGTGIASALHNGAAGGGRRIGGCSGGGGCGSGCGRRRRSVPSSKVPADVLNEIPTNFERLY